MKKNVYNNNDWIFVGFLGKINAVVKGTYKTKSGKDAVLVVLPNNISTFLPKGCFHKSKSQNNKDLIYISLPVNYNVHLTQSTYNEETKKYERTQLKDITSAQFVKMVKVEETKEQSTKASAKVDDLPF